MCCIKWALLLCLFQPNRNRLCYWLKCNFYHALKWELDILQFSIFFLTKQWKTMVQFQDVCGHLANTKLFTLFGIVKDYFSSNDIFHLWTFIKCLNEFFNLFFIQYYPQTLLLIQSTFFCWHATFLCANEGSIFHNGPQGIELLKEVKINESIYKVVAFNLIVKPNLKSKLKNKHMNIATSSFKFIYIYIYNLKEEIVMFFFLRLLSWYKIIPYMLFTPSTCLMNA